MRLLIIIAALTGASLAAEIFRARPELDTHWQAFKTKHGKKYKDDAEEAQRRQLWEENFDKVEIHNAEAAKGKHTYTLGQNKFSDWTPEEMKQLAGRKATAARGEIGETLISDSELDRQTLPASVDLRNDVCLSTIKDQDYCGSCWAFAATTPVEFAACRKAGSKASVKLSEQQLVDCDTGNSGCDGGIEYYAWKYILRAPGQASASSYPYVSGSTWTSGTCKYTSAMSAATVATAGSHNITVTTAMTKLANQGPIAAAINTLDGNFGSYASGIYAPTSCSIDLNHAVNLVGYGTQNGTPYWILRNSWGTSWGISGYMLIKRGVNMCGIESDMSAPTF